ncbi:type II toxin-antitoxin system VapC family toxin [Microbispora sp. ATCC PTA-5024]|uniref:type II toxin-antitoxin system VapC family toxin n=1 Tax=Microbispora sp. ATCC PTA-5024 TaxID=316330 RepID=UPI0005616A70|nr:type II toxin-antitoxin system VapC family toxin [Microbispora sp. ATCC PTA-5024]
MPERVTLVDSCVLLDIATNDPKWADWSAEALAMALDEGRVVVNPIVYAEVSIGFSTLEEFEEALPAEDFHREDIPFDAAFLAGKAILAYRRRGGGRRSPLPDFFIGAHAAVRRYRLLTRDEPRYRTYFPTVELVAP